MTPDRSIVAQRICFPSWHNTRIFFLSALSAKCSRSPVGACTPLQGWAFLLRSFAWGHCRMAPLACSIPFSTQVEIMSSQCRQC